MSNMQGVDSAPAPAQLILPKKAIKIVSPLLWESTTYASWSMSGTVNTHEETRKTQQSGPFWWEGQWPCGLFSWFQVQGVHYVLHSSEKWENSNRYFSFFLVLLLDPGTGENAEVESNVCQGAGVKYVGTMSTSKSGRRCQNWNSTEPQRGRGTVGEPENFCRNPHNSAAGVWCYTTNYYARWEYCEVWLIMIYVDDTHIWHIVRCPSVTRLLQQRQRQLSLPHTAQVELPSGDSFDCS